jgi:hypothetical protein
MLNPKPFNIKGFLYYLKKGEKNKYSLKDLDAKGTQFLMLSTYSRR